MISNNIAGAIQYSASVYTMVTDVNGNILFAVAPYRYQIEQAFDRTVELSAYIVYQKISTPIIVYYLQVDPVANSITLTKVTSCEEVEY